MARATRRRRGKTACLGLLILSADACAAVRTPPGGPPDFDPPVLLAVTPDSGSIHEAFGDRVVFLFDEVVSERSGGGLDRIFEVSPRHERISISWRRTSVAVKPVDGWIAGVVYHVTLLPGITDLSNNVSRETKIVTFSTGGEIPATIVSGTVVDWERGRLAQNALIEAIRVPDTLVYTGRTDSIGQFTLVSLPLGDYVIFATIDENRNRRRDRRERFDSLAAKLDSSLSGTFWAFSRDTSGPRLRTVTQVDSTTARLTFSQMLAPGEPPDNSVAVSLLPDSLATPVAAVLSSMAFDSLSAAIRPPDTTVTDTTVVADTTDVAAEEEVARAEAILSQRPRLSDTWFVLLQEPLSPGSRYLFSAAATNLMGGTVASRSLLITREAPPAPPATPAPPAPPTPLTPPTPEIEPGDSL